MCFHCSFGPESSVVAQSALVCTQKKKIGCFVFLRATQASSSDVRQVGQRATSVPACAVLCGGALQKGTVLLDKREGAVPSGASAAGLHLGRI